MTRCGSTDVHEWTRIGSEVFIPLRVTSRAQSFRATMTTMSVADLGVSELSFTPTYVERSAAMIAGDGRDDVLLNLQLYGRGTVIQGGRSVPLEPGSAAISEANRPYSLRFEVPGKVLTLQVPRERLRRGERAIRATDARALDASSAPLFVLRHYLGSLLRAGAATETDERLFADTAVNLLTALLGNPTSRPVHRRSGTQAAEVRAFIAANGSDPEFSLDDAASSLRISRRYMEKLLSSDGESPGEYLRSMRLSRAAALLRRDQMSTVTDIAFSAGFRDVTTFIRAFRRAYGITPGRWRTQA